MDGLAVLAEAFQAPTGRGVWGHLPEVLSAVEALPLVLWIDLAVFVRLVAPDAESVRLDGTVNGDPVVEAGGALPLAVFDFLDGERGVVRRGP
ncbi:hypothetical protein [Streptomyces sp. NPDC088554]|uniref:hypothetical protein n=1 Tax=Streptomyces sp. NPDC088554 TaxID=3365865 RepID=UPI00381D8877